MSDRAADKSNKASQVLRIVEDPSKTPHQQEADVALGAVIPGAVAAKRWAERSFFGEIGLNEAVQTISQQADQAANGDLDAAKRMLMSQATTLNAMFNELIGKCATLVTNKPDGTWNVKTEALEMLSKIAFKAQGQCRTTLQTLGELVNPRSVAFIRQANVANGPQQVNNGGAPAHAGETGNPANKLLEANPSERLDFGAAAASSRIDQTVEAVGAVHRAENRGGEVRSFSKRDQARAARR